MDAMSADPTRVSFDLSRTVTAIASELGIAPTQVRGAVDLLSDFGDSGQENQAATWAFPWSLGVHIRASPLGNATFLEMSELPLFLARYKSSSSTGTGVRYAGARWASFGRVART